MWLSQQVHPGELCRWHECFTAQSLWWFCYVFHTNPPGALFLLDFGVSWRIKLPSSTDSVFVFFYNQESAKGVLFWKLTGCSSSDFLSDLDFLCCVCVLYTEWIIVQYWHIALHWLHLFNWSHFHISGNIYVYPSQYIYTSYYYITANAFILLLTCWL